MTLKLDDLERLGINLDRHELPRVVSARGGEYVRYSDVKQLIENQERQLERLREACKEHEFQSERWSALAGTLAGALNQTLLDKRELEARIAGLEK